MTFLRDTGLVFWSQLRANLRMPVWVIIGLTQPILYLVLFGPLVKGVAGSFGPGADPWRILVPGLIMQMGLFGAMFVGFGMVVELRSGVIERQRVTPAARGSLLMGRVLKDVVVLMVQTLVLVAAASIAFGLRPDGLGLLLTLLLIAIIAAGMSSASYALALWARSEDTMASVLNSVTVPLMLLSGILLPMTVGPGWLQTIAKINPLSHTVDAARALFRGDFGSHDVYIGSIVTVPLSLVLILIGARSFARENA
jgi:ABC-2 type transport system permease protein